MKKIKYEETEVKILDCAAAVIAGILFKLVITSGQSDCSRDFLLCGATKNRELFNIGRK